jgi:hypothetical protein
MNVSFHVNLFVISKLSPLILFPVIGDDPAISFPNAFLIPTNKEGRISCIKNDK